MRILAILMILGGLGAGVILPWAQSNFIGEEIHKVTLYEKGGEWQGHRVALSSDQNPLKLNLRMYFVAGSKISANRVPVEVAVSGPDGIVLNGVLNVSTDVNTDSTNQNTFKSIGSPIFEIIEPGDYGIEARLGAMPDEFSGAALSISKVEAVVIAGAMEPLDDYKMYGIFVAFAGFYLLMRSRRNRRNQDMNTPQPPQKWGRG